MVQFGNRLLALAGIATAIAVAVVLMASEVVELGGGGRWSSAVIPGLVLFISSLLIPTWYESKMVDEESP